MGQWPLYIASVFGGLQQRILRSGFAACYFEYLVLVNSVLWLRVRMLPFTAKRSVYSAMLNAVLFSNDRHRHVASPLLLCTVERMENSAT